MYHIDIKRVFGSLKSMLAIIVSELKSKSEINFLKRMKLLLRGFYSSNYIQYNLEENDIKDYVSEYQFRKTKFINKDLYYILDNKIVFNKMIENYVKTAKNLSIISDGNIFPLEDDNKIKSVEDIISYLETEGNIILKRYIGTSCGIGILILKKTGDVITINGEEITFNNLKQFIKKLDQYLICEYVNQSEYGNSLYRDTVNTIRILTMMDPYDKEPFIASAVQRIGRKKSVPVDNGGFSAKVDIESGKLGKAVEHKNKKELIWFSNHPETGAKIEGKVVPNWSNVKEQLINLHKKLPYLHYVGWDVVPLEDDILIIEGNNVPQLEFMQIQEPLLKNDRVKRFYEFHNIV